MKDDSAFSKLEREVQLLDDWLGKKPGGRQCIRKHIPNYKRWDKLSSSLIDFLRSKPLADWTELDLDLCRNAISFDCFELNLLKPLSFDELLDLANQTTAPLSKGFQLYLALVCGNLQHSKEQLHLATNLFERAQSFHVQIETFKVLASHESALTEGYARGLWDSGDSEDCEDFAKQVAFLLALMPIRAQQSLLDEYLAKALKSEYPSVVSCATAIACIRDFGTQ